MKEKIAIEFWICEKEFFVDKKDAWMIFCPHCTKKYYMPVKHLVTLAELKEDWDNKKHILFNHPETEQVTCIHTGEVFEAPFNSGYFMTFDSMTNEFYHRLNKYGKESYGILKYNWKKILELENEIEKILTGNTDLFFMICKCLFEEINKSSKNKY